MDVYTFCLSLGGAGLGAMAFGGFARHSSTHTASQASGHAHAGALSHAAPLHPHAPLHAVPHAAVPHAAVPHAAVPHAAWHAWLGSLVSPRVLFGILLGFGTAGVSLAPFLGGAPRLVLALVAGLAFDRLLLTPLWSFFLRFASQPALTLETTIMAEARAVTAFDANGQGIVQVELDGQVVQILATLTQRDRALGHRVRAGEALRVEDVDAARNRCHVTLA